MPSTYRFHNRACRPDDRPGWIVRAVEEGRVKFVQPHRSPAFLTLQDGTRVNVDEVVVLNDDGSITKRVEPTGSEQ